MTMLLSCQDSDALTDGSEFAVKKMLELFYPESNAREVGFELGVCA